MPLSPKLYTFLCACFAALGATLLGDDLAVIASILIAPDFLAVTGVANAPNFLGFIVSSMLLGAFVGSIPASMIADAFSRRVSIVFGASIFIVGGILQTAAQSKGMMLAGRFFAGFGIGSLGTLCPLYQSEIAHPSQRGRVIATFQFFLGIGAVVAGWIAYGCAESNPNGPLRWRLPLGLQILPAVPLVALSFLLPESPRWLMIKGRETEALHTLARLHARGNTDDPFVQGEFQEMRAKVSEEAAEQTSWASLWTDRTNFRRVLLGITLQFSGQMSGVSAIQYYSPIIYESVGFSGTTTLMIGSISNIFSLIAEALCIAFLDKFGRLRPLIIGNIITGATFCVAAPLARQFVIGHGSYGQGIAFVAMTFVYGFTFSCCIGPLSWVYPVEILNTAIRAKGTALTTMSTWIANFMIGQVTPIAFAHVGRTLEEMDDYFRNNHWIVPLAKIQNVSATTREKELAAAAAAGHPIEEKQVKGHYEHRERSMA